MGVLQKIHQLQATYAEIPKTGYNKFQDYYFRTIDDVLSNLKNAMDEIGLICYPKKQKVLEYNIPEGAKPKVRCVIEATYCFADPDTGEELEFMAIGEGVDSGDKATYKALSGAQKYALTQALTMPCDGVDVESEEFEDKKRGR